LLPDGKVLVASGSVAYLVYTPSAELYDPATGNWTYTGSLNFARVSHTATLLSDGRVLVTGGGEFASATASAELYDPTTGNWTYTGSLHADRENHTATLLADGRVLVVGGEGTFDSYIASAELYDPATGNWTYTGSLNTGRLAHTATLLPNGKVLVAGGQYNWGSLLASAELYAPATGTWTVTGSLNTARYGHAATLLPNGEVLVAGGAGGGLLASAERYDPEAMSQITAAGTTCSQFASGTAETLGSVQYDVTNDLIQRLVPRNFLYWVKVTAPAGDNIFRITQTITTGNFNTFFTGRGNGSNVFDSNCVSLERSGSQIGDTVQVRFNAPAAGTYFIGINFNAQDLLGQPAPSPTTVHYDFTTTGVPDSTSGLDLVEH
jgi:hypothetical protein